MTFSPSLVDELVTPSSVTLSPSGGGKVPVQKCKPGQFACKHIDECVSVSVLCDGRADCKDHSDEINCGENFSNIGAYMYYICICIFFRVVLLYQFFINLYIKQKQLAFIHVPFSSSFYSGIAPGRGTPGLQNQTSSTGRPGIHGDITTGVPGLLTTMTQAGLPGLQKNTTSSTGIISCWSNWHLVWVLAGNQTLFFLCVLCIRLLEHQAIHLPRGHHRSAWTASHHNPPFWKTWTANHYRWEMRPLCYLSYTTH